MSKKGIAILLACVVVVGAGAGVYFLRANKGDTTPTTSTVSTSKVENNTEKAKETTKETEKTEATKETTIEEAIVTTNFSAVKCYDRTMDMEATPREVLGDEYASSYVKFDSDNNFRLNLGYKSKGGTYKIDANNMKINVSYDDDTEASYEITLDGDGNIIFISVPYGDYDVYFG